MKEKKQLNDQKECLNASQEFPLLSSEEEHVSASEKEKDGKRRRVRWMDRI